jgi:pyruvate dehydrogenase E2 component (dihydrolipoamide acetyltransferase)
MARDLGIALDGARGSGQGGRVMPGDLASMRPPEAATSKAPGPLALARPAAGEGLLPPEVRPLSMMRKTIARRLTESKQTVPHFYLTIDVDAGALAALREEINAELATSAIPAARGGAPPEKVSINDLLVKACAIALTRVPECNAQFAGDAIHVFHRIDISVAVAIPDGLITPVVRNADTKSVVAIAREVRDLAARARSKKLSVDEMTNGTFSISNLGMFGIDGFSAVINPPEGAILAVGRVRDEPAVRDGQVVAGKRLSLTLSCDHRVIDGAVGAAFLAELRGLVEHPLRVLTG